MSNEWMDGCATALTLVMETDSGHTCSWFTGKGSILKTIIYLAVGAGNCYGTGTRKWVYGGAWHGPSIKVAGRT